MFVTLATNYDRVYRDLGVHFVVAPLMLIVGAVFAWLIAQRKWNGAYTSVIVWAVVFPFARILLFELEGARGFMESNIEPASLPTLLCVSIFFIVIVLAVRVVRIVSRGTDALGFALALAWAVAFPLMIPLSRSVFGGSGILGGNAVTTALTALLLWRATRSWIPAAGCAVGLAAAELSFEFYLSPLANRFEHMWAASLVWNACVFASLMIWANQARPREGKPGVCAQCGYDLRATPGRPCPECGNAGMQQGWDG